MLHPIWEGQACWIGTHRDSNKRLHLECNQHVSLAWVSDPMHPVYVEALAAWDNSAETRHRIWNLFINTPEPLGYDPEPIFFSPDHENFGVLRIEPWKITLATPGGEPWQTSGAPGPERCLQHELEALPKDARTGWA